MQLTFLMQTIDSIGWTPVDGFNPNGTGPSDCIAYPDLSAVSRVRLALGASGTTKEAAHQMNHQLSTSSNSDIAQTISSNVQAYAQDAFNNGAAVSVEAALAVFKIQETLMINDSVGLVEVS